MTITTKKDITIENNVIIPKNTKGWVKGIQWGENKKINYVIDFPNNKTIIISKELVMED